MPVLLRDNASDPRVAADVSLLSEAYEGEAPEHTAVGDLALLADAYAVAPAESALPWWRAVLTHVGRYRTLYVVALALAAVLILRHPVPLPPGEDAASSSDVAEVNAGTAAAPAPSPAPDAAPTADAGLTSPDPFAAIGLDEAAVSPPIPFAPPEPAPAATPLRVTESGYASSFSGTPLEQPPPDGDLPVEALAGSTTRLSFVRLTGRATTLRLAQVSTRSDVNAAKAAIQLCRITNPAWTAQRDEPMSQAPPYDPNDCVKGAKSGSVWLFTMTRADRSSPNGFVIVPVLDASPTFGVTLSPQAQ